MNIVTSLAESILENILRDTGRFTIFDPVISLLGIYLKEIIQKKEKKLSLTKELFIMAKTPLHLKIRE